MPNMIESLGIEYFNSMCSGAMFAKNNKVYQVITATRSGTTCYDLSTEQQEVIPNDFFVGFKSFEYPILGYRRLSDTVSVYIQRKQSAIRGLRLENVSFNYTPFTTYLLNHFSIEAPSQAQKAFSCFFGKFDSLNDIPKLLNGEVSSLVLSPRIAIEPDTSTEDGWFTIYYQRASLGSMDKEGKITWNNPVHASILEGLNNV